MIYIYSFVKFILFYKFFCLKYFFLLFFLIYICYSKGEDINKWFLNGFELNKICLILFIVLVELV